MDEGGERAGGDGGLAERIRSLVGRRSVARFAKDCGIGESLMRSYLSGAMPGLDKAAAIARAGGVSLDWLATGTGPRATADAGDEPLLADACRIADLWLNMRAIAADDPRVRARVTARVWRHLARQRGPAESAGDAADRLQADLELIAGLTELTNGSS
jgi:hypothetical protein